MPAPAVQCAAGYEGAAQARLRPEVWQYLQGGSGNGDAQALAGVRLVPRPLRALGAGHTRLSLLGQALQHPLLLAPVAYQRLFHADGEVASALAAVAQGGQSILSSLASQPLGHITQAASRDDGVGPWFQLYWQGTRERTHRLLLRALAAGCSVVVFTIDAPVKLATLQLPEGISAVNLEGGQLPAPPSDSVFGGWMAQAPTWDDLAWLRGQTPVPLVLKGVLHADDAERAVSLGCDGVVVSNHGGRVLEGAPVALHALQPIVQRLGGQVPVLFDSGIRSGRDAFVALAHGAAAVLLGRPCVWGLAAQGALGVAHVLRLARDELEMTMALTGCATLADIGPQCLAPGT